MFFLRFSFLYEAFLFYFLDVFFFHIRIIFFIEEIIVKIIIKVFINIISMSENYTRMLITMNMKYIFFSIYFLSKFKKFLRYYPLKLFKNRMSDGTLRHFYAEVLCNGCADHSEGVLRLLKAALLHRR